MRRLGDTDRWLNPYVYLPVFRIIATTDRLKTLRKEDDPRGGQTWGGDVVCLDRAYLEASQTELTFSPLMYVLLTGSTHRVRSGGCCCGVRTGESSPASPPLPSVAALSITASSFPTALASQATISTSSTK